MGHYNGLHKPTRSGNTSAVPKIKTWPSNPTDPTKLIHLQWPFVRYWPTCQHFSKSTKTSENLTTGYNSVVQWVSIVSFYAYLNSSFNQ